MWVFEVEHVVPGEKATENTRKAFNALNAAAEGTPSYL